MRKCGNCQNIFPDEFDFCGRCGTKYLPQNQDELKLVSVLFADLAGFTSFSETLEPDEIKEIIDSLFSTLTRTVTSEGGEVIKYEGDCLMAAFGLLKSSDNDPLHACYAALRMQEDLKKFISGMKKEKDVFSLRIGIHTGKVACGLIGGRKDIMGDAVNLAARMEQNAPAGGILITADHARLLKGRFLLKEAGQLTVKGKKDPVCAAQVLGRAPVLQRKVLGIELPLLCRKAELDCCIELFDRVNNEIKPQMIVYEGLPGTGKSRIIKEFEKYCGAHEDFIFRMNVFHDSTISSECRFLKVLLKSKLELKNEAELSAFLLSRGFFWENQDEHCGVLSLMAGLSTRYSFPGNETIIEYLMKQSVLELLKSLSEKNICIFFLDDIQWMDELSIKLISHVLDHRKGKLLFVCSARPQWKERCSLLETGSVTVPLRPFEKTECREFLKKILEGNIPENLVDFVYDFSEGNPLFMEEVMISLSESGVIRNNDGKNTVDTEKLKSMKTPDSVNIIMQSRLEALGNENLEILKKGSLTGMQFIPALVSELCEKKDLTALLRLFTEKGIFLPSAVTDDSGYSCHIFSHALIRDAVCERLTQKQKKKLHDEIRKWFSQLQVSDSFKPDLLKKVFYHSCAAENYCETLLSGREILQEIISLKQYQAAEEYIAVIERILLENFSFFDLKTKMETACLLFEIMPFSGKSDKTRQIFETISSEAVSGSEEWLNLHFKYTDLLIYYSELEKAELLLETMEDSVPDEKTGQKITEQILLLKAEYFFRKGFLDQALQACLSFSESSSFLTEIQHKIARTYFFLSDYENSLKYYLLVLKQAEKNNNTYLAISVESNMALIYQKQGNYTLAEELMKKGLDYDLLHGDYRGTCIDHNNLGLLFMETGDYQKAEKHLNVASLISEKIGYVTGTGLALQNLAEVKKKTGSLESACDYLKQSIEIFRNSKEEMRIGHCCQDFGILLLEMGKTADAIEYLEQAGDIFEKIGLRQETVALLFNLAKAEIQLENKEKAVLYAEKALQAETEFPAAGLKIEIMEFLEKVRE